MKRSLLAQYIYEKRRLMFAALCWVLVFYIVFFYYDIKMEVLWYPTLICVCLFLLYGCYSFWRFVRRHKQIVRATESIELSSEELPEADTQLEADYQELLQTLRMEKNAKMDSVRNNNDQREEYIGLWSHQIKTPLTAAQLIAEDLEEETKAELSNQLFEMEQYVDMLLQYQRIENNNSDFVFKSYSLRQIVNQSVKYFARVFIRKGLRVQVNIPEELTVVTDEKWLVFALKQILSNALKYTKQGSITVNATVSETSVVLSIIDTGIGIAKEDLPRILEQGYTGYNGRKDKKATGLGLYITDRILKMLGHQIYITSPGGEDVTNEANPGTRVDVTFNNKGVI